MSENWRPSASLAALQLRAEIYRRIRDFFAAAGVMEVETPVLSRYGVTDVHLASFRLEQSGHYLQTSPEYAMKRLLAAGSGPIYQLCKAFRQAEQGARHNPEFSMLEWYRPGFDEQQLMDEVAGLMTCVLGPRRIEKYSYRALFQAHLGFDPHQLPMPELRRLARERTDFQAQEAQRDTLLELLLSHCIEPALGRDNYSFVYDYPASQAALAQLHEDASGTLVAKRFELYVEGMELANGYLELSDAREQQQRFEQDLLCRRELNLPLPEPSPFLLAALSQGLPQCAGVALGIDRLLMLLGGYENIAQVLAFPFDRA